MTSSTSSSRRPVHEIRLGRIKAAIWANQSEAGVRHNVTVRRIYKDGETWRSSESFSREDLPLHCKVLDSAHTWLYTEANSQLANSQQQAEPGF